MLPFIITRSGRHVDRLGREPLEFIETKGPVVERRRQPKTEFHERLLTGPVSLIHRTELRHGHVALVDDQDGIVGHVIEQARRRLALGPPGQVARVVLDAGTVAELPDHLEIK